MAALIPKQMRVQCRAQGVVCLLALALLAMDKAEGGGWFEVRKEGERKRKSQEQKRAWPEGIGGQKGC